MHELIGDLMGAAGEKISDLTRVKVGGAVARKVKAYNSQGWLRPIWTNADENLVTLIAVADVLHELGIAPLRGMNEERMLDYFKYNYLSDAEVQASLYAMYVEQQLLRDMRALCGSLPILANALVSTGFFAALADRFTDLFSGSQQAFNGAARAELKRLCDRNIRELDAILPILDECVRFAQPGGLLGRSRR